MAFFGQSRPTFDSAQAPSAHSSDQALSSEDSLSEARFALVLQLKPALIRRTVEWLLDERTEAFLDALMQSQEAVDAAAELLSQSVACSSRAASAYPIQKAVEYLERFLSEPRLHDTGWNHIASVVRTTRTVPKDDLLEAIDSFRGMELKPGWGTFWEHLSGWSNAMMANGLTLAKGQIPSDICDISPKPSLLATLQHVASNARTAAEFRNGFAAIVSLERRFRPSVQFWAQTTAHGTVSESIAYMKIGSDCLNADPVRGWNAIEHATQAIKRAGLSFEAASGLAFGTILSRSPEGSLERDAQSLASLTRELIENFPSAGTQAFSVVNEQLGKKLLKYPAMRGVIFSTDLRRAIGEAHGDLRLFEKRVRLYSLAVVTDAVLDVRSNEELAAINQDFASPGRIDNLPYRLFKTQVVSSETHGYGGFADEQRNPEAQRAYNQTLQIMRRCREIEYGFGALAFEARRPPRVDDGFFGISSPALLLQVATDISSSVDILNSSSNNDFPGAGVRLNGVLRERVFAQNPVTLDDPDPYSFWKNSVLPDFAPQFDDLDHTKFTLARGFIAVTPPRTPEYQIAGKHYSLLVYNDHFRPDLLDRSLLVPTDILEDVILDNAMTPYLDYRGFDPRKRDLCKAPRSTGELLALGEGTGLNVLQLRWGSNIGGGLCNAFPPGSSPYHRWEVRKNIPNLDAWDHRHKSYIEDGTYASTMTPEMDRLLEPLRRAHDEVYAVATSVLNLFDLLRVSTALWHKGQTAGAGVDESEELELQDDEQGTSPNPNSGRVLRQALRFHYGAQQKALPDDAYPIARFSHILDYRSMPFADVSLDTKTMKLTVAGVSYALLPQSKTELEAGWYEAGTESPQWGEVKERWDALVGPFFRNPWDLRFYDRREFKEEL